MKAVIALISASFVTIFIGVLFILANLEKEFKLNLRQTFLFFFFGVDYGRCVWKLAIFTFNTRVHISEAFFDNTSLITN